MMKNHKEKLYIEETPESLRCPYTYWYVLICTTESVVISDFYAKTGA
jgi:hypothetical protein